MQIKKRILIVDDETSFLEMYKIHLNKFGYQVFIAKNGEEGCNLAKSKKPDVIFLDIVMSGMDGFAALKKLKKDSDTKDIPVIMLTNIDSGADQKEAEKLGCAGYYIKSSVTPSDLDGIIEKILG